MNKKQYEAMRKKLMDEAEGLINEGKIKEADSKMDEIKALDEKWDAIAQAQANFKALNGEPKPLNVFEQNGSKADFGAKVSEPENIYNSQEYRIAFMNYVVNGTKIPEKFKNEVGPTKTGDIGSVIAPVLISRIIEKMESIGMILPLVTKTTFASGARIPTSSVKPVATWVAEGGTSEKQKKTTGYIDIRGFKLRCAISMTLEAVTMSLAVFETVFVNSIAEAMVKAQEEAIVNGDGEGKPKGILNETAPEGQSIEVGDKDSLYKKLVEAEAALPLAYENGAVWNMTKKTFMAFVGEMDANGQPIARVNQGIDGKPERTLLGRKVVLNDYMDSYGAATETDATVAFLYDWSDYMFNTNYAMTVKKYEDNDTEDEITKAVMICDGKSLELNSLVVMKKKAA